MFFYSAQTTSVSHLTLTYF